ncbi:MAG: adenylate/guanylate cyclase domain-containing protein [Thiolinea sp.]
MGTAYKLWINDKHVTSVGTVGTQAETTVPASRPEVVAFSYSPQVTLTLQIANFHHRKGGMWNSIVLGTEEQIRKEQRLRDHFDLFLLGSLLMMAFYHLGLYSLRSADRSTLYFGLFCLIIGTRSLFYREMPILTFLPDISWETINFMRYVTTYTAMPVFMMFVSSLYPTEFSKPVLRLAQLISALFIGIVLFSSVKIYSFTMLPYQIITLLACGYVAYVLYLGVKNRHRDVWWFIAGYSTLFATVINDVLVDNYLIDSVLLIPFGLFLFIFSQAIIISLRFSRAFLYIEKLTDASQRFVPAEFLSKLEKEDIINIKLGDHTRHNMSIMFADIRSFSSMSENMTSQETFKFLNSYFGRMEPVINRHHGFIDKYVGDGIMALFGEQADNAVDAAIAMLHTLREYNGFRQNSGYVPVHIGIGINSGELMLGTIGARNRMEGTVISDTVNLASRVEQLTKKYQAALIISEHTLRALDTPDKYYIRMLDRVQVKGKTEFVAIYEVFNADPQKLRLAKASTRQRFEEAVTHYRQGNYATALSLFKRCLTQAPDDTTTQMFIKRIQRKLTKASVDQQIHH